MILVTVGTQFFDELIEVVDDLAARSVLKTPIFAQIGLSKIEPRFLDHVAFDRNLLQKAADANLIITHAGTGSLLEFIKLGRPMIAVVNPTKADNHQLEFLQALETVCDFCWVDSPSKLEAALPQVIAPRMRAGSLIDSLVTDMKTLFSTGKPIAV